MLQVCCGMFCTEPWVEVQRSRGAVVVSAFMQKTEGMQGCSCTVQVSEQCRDMPNLCWKKYNLVPQCLISSIAPLISFRLLILRNRIPVKISIATLNVRAFFILVFGFWFARFNPQLTVKLSIRSIWPLISRYWLKNSNRPPKISFSSIEPELNSRNWFLID